MKADVHYRNSAVDHLRRRLSFYSERPLSLFTMDCSWPKAGIDQIATTASSIDYAKSTRSQPLHDISRHLIPIGLIQDLMPRRRVQLDHHIGHTGIPTPLPQLLNQYPACGQRVCVAGCNQDG